MAKKLNILLLEDCASDAGLIEHEFKKAGFQYVFKLVSTKIEFENALQNFKPDIVLSDHSLPQFTSVEALKVYKASECSAPFILVTGAMSEEFAVTCIKTGIHDYILKSNLVRLPSAVTNAIKTKNAELEKEKAQQELLMSEIQIRNFATHLNGVLEDERTRIAREIHDELGQQLTGIKLSLALFKKQHRNTDGVEDKINEVLTEIDTTIQTLRKIATELRPGILDALGLVPAIRWLSKEFEKKSNIKCIFNSNISERLIEKNLSTCIFRICQETLTNIAKHSEAKEAVIEINVANNILVFEICDNGIGFNVDKMKNPLSMGLIGIRERAKIIGADLIINSVVDSGTSVKLSLNLD